MKIFLTGATGYIGGDALFHISKHHPDAQLSLLVRSQDKADTVQQQYPDARIVLGGLDDSEIIRREAAWADVVLHTADSSDHEKCARDIAHGLVEGHSRARPGYWLHLGGTGILTYFDSEVKKSFGEPDDKVFDDLDGVHELVSLPADAFHRNVDQVVLDSGTHHADRVKTAIICPPTIYGRGRGPVSQRGRQVYQLTSFILEQGYVPRIGRGLARWNNVHIHDLTAAIDLLLLEASASVSASKPRSEVEEKHFWGPHGYFLTENGEHAWGDLAVKIGREAHRQGLLPAEPEVREWPMDEAVKSPAGFEAASWGLNSRARALRARKFLGWQPKQPSLEDEIPTLVRSEAARRG